MASVNRSVSSFVDDYAQMRTIPAVLSLAFVLASLYMFGGMNQVTISWVGYTLEQSHTMLISLGAYAVAFASSETKRFESYEQWEQAAIAAGPAVILLYEYLPAFKDFLLNLGDPLGFQLAFVVTVVSWAVATQ